MAANIAMQKMCHGQIVNILIFQTHRNVLHMYCTDNLLIGKTLYQHILYTI
jgi:hypothetical protein